MSSKLTPARLIKINVHTLQLKVRVSVVCSGWVDSMLVADNLFMNTQSCKDVNSSHETSTKSYAQRGPTHLPEFGTNLVTTLACLNMDDLTHGVYFVITNCTKGFSRC